MKLRSKRYKLLKEKIDTKKVYNVDEASKLVKQTANTKFNSSIDIAIKLNLDTTKAEQQLRGNLALPYYFGKSTKVLVLDDSLTIEEAKANKIDYFGGTDQIAKIKEG
jgi:large subunit ribosomal protein L1